MSNKKTNPIARSEAHEATPEGVVEALEQAAVSVRGLIARRKETKMSVARLAGLARELRELIKVMSVYGV